MNNNEAYQVAPLTEDEQLYRCFVQGKAEEPVDDETFLRFKEARFSWCTFFVGILYLVYRKLYVEAGIIFACELAIGFFTAGKLGSLWISVVEGVVTGALFYPLYRRKFWKYKDTGEDKLKEKGGTNFIAAFVTLGAAVTIWFIVYTFI